ncbi:hypothetical protein EQU06_06675 [Lactobacillus sanfranciscensis]|uniref:Type II methyltransferase M.TaqI-like domain-containing protein n=1 Tax=Fructilactobacillus sanfranciscensis (strain TMW 1.1304) TaxID=714313 RepID=G2KTZ3_FRUST|nr:Eco57I restriction-modification methylase domain-containing protein [Fructilactobacillus sanfranciscensis]AEN98808.1 hypothetical protein LSA_03560 [Fructilactobacillus sanfranciscensis TMW 1.1304]NDR76475.1 hypothetical protein [Fructilactobacillus sanfranciscensis]NDS05017.1 hypothetical protein [Fructilactobacillus sanfranciscensis]
MKFDVIVGNPPYQGDAKQQIYTDFYLSIIGENTPTSTSGG